MGEKKYQITLIFKGAKMDKILMPKNLTAENGAKALLNGEFYEIIEIQNPDYCGGDNYDKCQFCNENPDEPEFLNQKVHVSWTTIKNIYKKAVKHLEIPRLSMIPEEEFVISKKDTSVCMGSGELKPCPFCGRDAISSGRINNQTGITGYNIHCTGLEKCMGSVHGSDIDPEKAREKAVRKWNSRV